MPAEEDISVEGDTLTFAELAIIFGGALAGGLVCAILAPRLPRLAVGQALADRLAMALIVAWASLLGTMAVLQQLSFRTHAYDLGIFDQVLWNSARGRLFENSIMADSPNFLGHHFSPLLLALVPLYWLRADPSLLLVAQAALLALAGLPIYWLARDLLPGRALALSVLVAYLLHPATAYIALFDFHELALATPLLALALLFLSRRQYARFAVSLSLAFLVKEEVGLIGAFVGLVIVVAHRKRLAGMALFGGGIAWTLLLTRHVIPHFHPSGQYFFDALYAEAGSSPLGALVALLTQPEKLWSTVVTPGKQAYLQQLLLPLGALPLLGWQGLLVALPTLGYLLLASVSPNDLIRTQYSATLLAPLLAGCIYGLRCLHGRWLRRPRLRSGLAGFLLAAGLLGAYLYGPLPFASHFEGYRFKPAVRLAVAREVMAGIPPEASVIAQSDLVPQLSQRRTIQLLGLSDQHLRPDFYLFDTNGGSSRWPFETDEQYNAALSRILTDAEYNVVDQRQGYILARREVPDVPRPLAVTFGNGLKLAGYRLDTAKVRPGDTLRFRLFWQALAKPDDDYTLFAHFVDATGRGWGQHDGFPLGQYLPTSQWEEGKLRSGEWTVPIASDTPGGTYNLRVGLYLLATMRGVPITSGVEPGSDAVFIGPIEVQR